MAESSGQWDLALWGLGMINETMDLLATSTVTMGGVASPVQVLMGFGPDVVDIWSQVHNMTEARVGAEIGGNKVRWS